MMDLMGWNACNAHIHSISAAYTLIKPYHSSSNPEPIAYAFLNLTVNVSSLRHDRHDITSPTPTLALKSPQSLAPVLYLWFRQVLWSRGPTL